MGWYQVTKTINGRQYLYLQMTYRLGRSVKTKNKYLGPVSIHTGSFGFSAETNLPTAKALPQNSTPKPSGGLKIDKIKRFKKHPSLKSAYMKNSLWLMRNDARREKYAYDKQLHKK